MDNPLVLLTNFKPENFTWQTLVSCVLILVMKEKKFIHHWLQYKVQTEETRQDIIGEEAEEQSLPPKEKARVQ